MNTRNKILLGILFILISLNLIYGWAQAEPKAHPEASLDVQIQSKKLDKKAAILAAYLARFNSPLQYHAQDFVDAANQYNLDWKLVAAIAGVESTFGKHIPGGYNGWGWGVYGTQAIYFNSWRDGIFTVSKGLRENYLNRGLTEPYSINRAYATSPHWGWKVTFFMNDLEKYAQNYAQTQPVTDTMAPVNKVAAISGQLAFKQ